MVYDLVSYNVQHHAAQDTNHNYMLFGISRKGVSAMQKFIHFVLQMPKY
jgi:hypothetical protein